MKSKPRLDTKAAPIGEEPDIGTASDAYRKRFIGRTGEWFLQQQQEHLLSLLEPWEKGTILDVGGGHGQYTRELVRRGYAVTVLGSSPYADTQIRDLVASSQCQYMIGDLTHLPAADKSYDIVVSFRLLTHIQDWRGLLCEAGRVARDAVIVDFAPLRSFNALYPALFWLKRACEGDMTRTFRVFMERDILATFGEAGFVTTGRRAQYFLPMVFHRMLRAHPLSMFIERTCRSLGLTSVFGSPVILRVEPKSAGDALQRA